MAFEFGDVVVVPFPFVDIAVSKTRPALVFSKQAFNAANGQTVLAMITTASRSTWQDDIVLEDGAAAGLSHASLIRWKMFTLPNELIMRKVGALSNADRSRVIESAKQIFGAS
jgi:mRNA interferase MazF